MSLKPRGVPIGIMGLCLVLATPAFGQWFQDGVRVPDRSWSKSSGNFGAMLLLLSLIHI